MAFKFKDLVVDLGPGAQERHKAGRLQEQCGPCSWQTPPPVQGPCGPCSWQTPPQTYGLIQALAAKPPVDLHELKASLRQALDQIEAHEQEAAAGEKPQTLAQAEDLERRLEGALAELREHKKQLK